MPKYTGVGSLEGWVEECSTNLEALQNIEVVYPDGNGERKPVLVRIIGKGKGSIWQWDLTDAPICTLKNVKFINEVALVFSGGNAHIQNGVLTLDFYVRNP